ncbi:hypothetical protein FE88_01990 [Azospirillum brasilense]|nr:hypothetical protein FE89_02105 [Azospirillum brasilense]OPH22373.1 hypothetical protein FE88_01990 [Azospirillum brasilense]PWC95557.1 hypothetical protein AEJ54_06450 [Azospirillum sp. Sp 7]
MSLRISEVVIYAHDGRKRTVRFKEQGLSIVTGASKTGKSSLIDIIDFCMGGSECHVADGVIRRFVSWYGVLFDRGDTGIFVARRNPPPGQSRSPDIYLETGDKLASPDFDKLTKNITVDALEAFLTSALGISENLHSVPEGQTRQPLSANVRHALLFSLQDQDEIDSRRVLFHRQSEPFMPQAIKDVLPYFLGAIDEERLRRQSELDNARRELRKLEKREAQRDAVESLSLSRTNDIYREAQAAGLVGSGPVPPIEQALAVLRAVGPAVDEGISEPDVQQPLGQLRAERRRIRAQLAQVREEIRQAREIEEAAGGFMDEVHEQAARLLPIGLLPNSPSEPHSCALCGSELHESIPSAEEIRSTLEEVGGQLEKVRREVPRLQNLQVDLIQRQAAIEAALRENQRQIDDLVAKEGQFRSEQDARLRRARTAGRIAYFLETLPANEDDTNRDGALDALRKKIGALAELLDPDEVRDRLASIVNVIGAYMSEYSDRLDLEHSGSNLRLDIRTLAVVADTIDGPVPLNRMGSGENWVGYHVLAHLSLHKWFRQKRRPVPAFLIFDQPSQAHYPPERDSNGDVSILQDADREAVYKLFKLIADVAAELSPGFQIIVIDHADLKDPWFSGAVVERWRGEALVPPAWIS